MDERVAVYGMSRREIAEMVARLGMPSFRADQLWHWLYVGLAETFDEMTSLSLADRTQLKAVATIGETAIVQATHSEDQLAVKALHRLKDGRTVESVVMHYADPADDPTVEELIASEIPDATENTGAAEDMGAVEVTGAAKNTDATKVASLNGESGGRNTLCLSTQAGCAMGCVFCATGQMGLERDLSRSECVEQVVIAARRLKGEGKRLTNVVFMGMGEPLANWSATWGTVETLTDPKGFAMSPRRLTISTVGIVPGILRLAASRVPVRLAVSLHAPNDDLRSRLVAVNRTYPLADILDACRVYQRDGGRRITFEYVLIDGVNDSMEQAAALGALLQDFNSHVNLIPLNPTEGSPSPMRPSTPKAARLFAETLRASGLPVTLRLRRGIAIAAGCGQLRARHTAGRIGRTIPLDATRTDAALGSAIPADRQADAESMQQAALR